VKGRSARISFRARLDGVNQEWSDFAFAPERLGAHLLDTAQFWFGDIGEEDVRIVSSRRFENRAPDHVVLASNATKPQLELEMTLLSWRNHFTCDLFAEKGSVHIRSLCKWGPSSFTLRRRLLPSGRPPEDTVILTQDDPTWELEYAHFKKLCAGKHDTDLSSDIRLSLMLRQLAQAAIAQAQQ